MTDPVAAIVAAELDALTAHLEAVAAGRPCPPSEWTCTHCEAS